jgi:hypothetical protein
MDGEKMTPAAEVEMAKNITDADWRLLKKFHEA